MFGKYGKRITDPAELREYRLSYVPAALRDQCQHVKCKTGDAEAWIWSDKGRAYAVGFSGRGKHPWSRNGGQGAAYYFKTPEARRSWVAELFADAMADAKRAEERKAQKAAARAKPHALQVGDVLRSSWGYDQTNIDYYEVTKLVGSQMVEVRRIACQSEETAHMQGVSVPAPGHYIGEPKRCKVSDYGNRDSVKVSEVAHAYKMTPRIVGGVKVFNSSSWTAYA
jgi:hypothetical protein